MLGPVVVVGAGVAGISSTYYLSLAGFSEIHCFDDGKLNAPSRDKYKITRVDYADIKTMKRAMASHNIWQTLSDFNGFIEKQLRLVAYKNHNTYRQIANNRKELMLGERLVLSQKDVWEKYEVLFPEDAIVVLEEDDYLINLSECIENLLSVCKDRGVKFSNEHVDRVDYSNGSFSGIVLAGDRKIDYTGATVVLAAGPWSEALLKQSGKKVPANRMAKCVQCFAFLIEVDVHRTHPIVSELGIADFTPYEDGHAKLTWIPTYSRFEPENDSKTHLALQSLLGAIKWLHETVPGIKEVKVTEIFSWPDGMTEGENPLIAKDPSDPSTILVHGLSYTQAKGLTYIGKEVTSIARGDSELHPCHGWDPEPDPLRRDNQPSLRPHGAFDELNNKAKEYPEVVAWKSDHPGWEEGKDIVPYLDVITFN